MEKTFKNSEAGLGFMDRLLLIALLLGGAFYAMAHFGGPVWDYYVMKELARTVVSEYKDLDPAEVARRVDYELSRNHINNEDEKFTFAAKEGGGYKAIVDVHIPLTVTVSSYSIAEDKEWVLHYEAGK